MRFALVSDIHFGPAGYYDGRLRKLSHEAGPLTRRVLSDLETRERPELLVNLGDVIEDESPETDRAAYSAFLEALATWSTPVLHVAGNHDQVNLEEQDLRELWGHVGPLHYSRDVGGVHFAVLRADQNGLTDVTLPRDQLEWLAADLAAARLPAVVLLHHPLAEMTLTGNRWFEREPHLCLVVNRREVRDVIASSGKVLLVLNGHAHWTHIAVHDGIPYVTLQSLTENLELDAPGRAARAYGVVEIGERSVRVRVQGEEPVLAEFEPASSRR